MKDHQSHEIPREARLHRELDSSSRSGVSLFLPSLGGRLHHWEKLPGELGTDLCPFIFATKLQKEEEGKKKKHQEHRKVTDRCGIPWIPAALSCCSQETLLSWINVGCSLPPPPSLSLSQTQSARSDPGGAKRNRFALDGAFARPRSKPNSQIVIARLKKRNNVLHDRVPSAGTTDHNALATAASVSTDSIVRSRAGNNGSNNNNNGNNDSDNDQAVQYIRYIRAGKVKSSEARGIRERGRGIKEPVTIT